RRIATDVHALSSLDDAYNQDFLCAADILFMSDELLPEPAESFAWKVIERFATQVLVIGQGARGALLAVREDRKMMQVPAVRTRAVVNTIGAGDALMAAFLHEYQLHGDPYEALRSAVVFASYKIGAKGAAEGFLSEAELKEWRERVSPNR
ncbi:MAG TPA: carbohydrate kinase family protein, partial [Anaerolineaceae bacterium]